MKKIIKVFIILSILSVTYYGLNKLCQMFNNNSNRYNLSHTKEKAVENSYYLFNYKPIKDKIKLKYHNDSIYFKEVWVENIWADSDKRCLFTNFTKTDKFHIVVDYEEVMADTNRSGFVFVLKAINCPERTGTMNNYQKEIFTDQLPDTLWLKISERTPIDSIGWRKELFGDTIGFIK